MEKINDSNFKNFIKNKKAVLFLTLSYCPYCRAYKKEIAPLMKKHSKIKFGCADVEEGNTDELEATMTMPDYFPTAILFKDGKEICRLESGAGDPATTEELDAAVKEKFV